MFRTFLDIAKLPITRFEFRHDNGKTIGGKQTNYHLSELCSNWQAIVRITVLRRICTDFDIPSTRTQNYRVIICSPCQYLSVR